MSDDQPVEIYTRELDSIFTDIPFDCMNIVFEYFDDYRALARVSQTCWWSWELAQEEDLWKSHCRRYLNDGIYHSQLMQVQKAEVRGSTYFCTWQSLLRKNMTAKKAKAITEFVQQAMGSGQAVTPSAELQKVSALVFASDGVCIGSQGAKSLAGLLQHNTRLSTLDLSRQLVRDSGLVDLAGALSGCAQLQTLILTENQIKDTGVEHLCASLTKLHFLNLVDLRKNGITHAACPALATLIKSSPALTDLYLSENLLEDKGVLTVLQAAAERVSLWQGSWDAEKKKNQNPQARRQWYLPIAVLALCSVGLSSKSWKTVIQESKLQAAWEKASGNLEAKEKNAPSAAAAAENEKKKSRRKPGAVNGPKFQLDLRTVWMNAPVAKSAGEKPKLTNLQEKLENKCSVPTAGKDKKMKEDATKSQQQQPAATHQSIVCASPSLGLMPMTLYMDPPGKDESGCVVQ